MKLRYIEFDIEALVLLIATRKQGERIAKYTKCVSDIIRVITMEGVIGLDILSSLASEPKR